MRITCIENKLYRDTLEEKDMKDTRKKMESIIKDEFRDFALHIHNNESLTQMKMANALLMDRRSIADIESGEHMCGELTIILMLIHLEDANPFLQNIRRRLEAAYYGTEVYV